MSRKVCSMVGFTGSWNSRADRFHRRRLRHRLIAAAVVGLLAMSPGIAKAELVVTVDPDDLVHNGPGIHEVDFRLHYSGEGASTFDGLRFDILNASNATIRQGSVTTDFSGLVISTTVNSQDQFLLGTPTQLEAIGEPGTRLTTLAFDVLDNQDFTIGLEFVELSRNLVTVTDPNPPVLMPSSFTVTAVPEPSSVAVLGCIVGAVGFGVRLKRRRARSLS